MAAVKFSSSIDISGSVVAQSMTSSLLGTASYANTSSYLVTAQTASFITGSNVIGIVSQSYTASYISTAQTASFITGSNVIGIVSQSYTASYIATAQTASFITGSDVKGTVTSALTASLVSTSLTASFITGSGVKGTVENAYTAAFTLSASYVNVSNVLSQTGVGFSRSLYMNNPSFIDGWGYPLTYSAIIAQFSESIFQFYGRPKHSNIPGSPPEPPMYGRDGYSYYGQGYQTVHIDSTGNPNAYSELFGYGGLTIGYGNGGFKGIGIWANGVKTHIKSNISTTDYAEGHMNFTIQQTGSSNLKITKNNQYQSASVVINSINDENSSSDRGALVIFGANSPSFIDIQPHIQLRDIQSERANNTNSHGIYVAMTGSKGSGQGVGTPGECLHLCSEQGQGQPYFRAFANFNNASYGRFAMGYTQYVASTTEANAYMMPSNTVSVSGSIFASAFNTTSDRRLKENIEDIQYGLSTIESLRPVEFNWIGDESKDKKLGFIAQEVMEIVPEAVGGVENEGDYYQFDVASITPVNTKAIQELAVENRALRSTIEALVARVEALENK